MIIRVLGSLLVAAALLPAPLAGQGDRSLAIAEAAWQALEYDSVLVAAHAALEGQLTLGEQVRAHELLAFTYATLDSADRAIEAFRQVVYLDPDRVYDPQRISPLLVQLHTIALGRELVVRRLTVDSTSFVAGRGTVRIRFEVSRPAEYQVRIAGPGLDSIISRGNASGTTAVEWTGLAGAGVPAKAGAYRVVVSVSQFADRYSRPVGMTVRHGQVDTVAHLTRLEGLDELPETETPSRSWLPLVISSLAAGVGSGIALALESGPPDGARRELFVFDIAAVASGFALSRRQPPPRPLPSNVEYNRRVRLMLDQRNAAIAEQNAELGRQVVLTIVPAPADAR